jgi:4-hydroxy-2-oxoheptanedioate aldolase
MIESASAVEQLAAILDAAGIDARIIESHNLTVSLSVPGQYEHPAARGAIAAIIRGCAAWHPGGGAGVDARTRPARA